MVLALLCGGMGTTAARERTRQERPSLRRPGKRHHPAPRRMLSLRTPLDGAPAPDAPPPDDAPIPAAPPPAHATPSLVAAPLSELEAPPRHVDPDLAPALSVRSDILLHLRGSRPRLLAFAMPRGQLTPEGQPRRIVGAGWLRLGFSDQVRYRSTTTPSGPGQTAYEMDFRPFVTTNPKLFANMITALSYEPSLTVPLQAAQGDTPGRYTLIHRGELDHGWRSADRGLEVSLRGRIEYGDRDFRAPGGDGGGGDALDSEPTTDVVSVLNLTANLGIEKHASDTHSLELQLELRREGGYGFSESGIDARSLLPEVVSPLAIVRDAMKVGDGKAVVISVEGSYNDVSYGDAGGGGAALRGGPSSWALAADVAFRHRGDAGEVGASVGGALYSTPALPFESFAQNETTPNRTVLTPIGALWMTRKLGGTIELTVDGALQPKIDRIAATIAPRVRVGANLRWHGRSGLYATGNGDFSLDLGDGRSVDADGSSDYFSPKGYQFAAHGGVGYQHRRWVGLEVGLRYQRILREQAALTSGLPTERWTGYAELRFVWDAVK